MTYIELLNRFWDRNRDDKFSTATIALYLFLLSENSRRQWPESFLLSTQSIEEWLGMSRNTIAVARQNLVRAGLIETTSLRGPGSISYKICDADVKVPGKRKRANLDFVDRLTIAQQFAQKLCNSWGQNHAETAEKIAFEIAQILCKTDNQTAQLIAQSIAQILCKYTLYNDSTNVLSKRNKEISPLTPLMGEREKYNDFLARYFDDVRRGSIDPLCKNFGVSFSRFKQLAEDAIDEICGAGEPFTDFSTVARKMQNLVRLKARYETSKGAARQQGNPYGIPIGPGEWFDVDGHRRYDESPIFVPIEALPRPSANYRWDSRTNRWIL